MARDWESTFVSWAKPPSETEEAKCSHALDMVRSAIRASPKLEGRRIQVFTQGSYRNNTNVRQDSDVDICVRCMEPFFTDYTHAPGASNSTLGFSASPFTFAEFKNQIGEALAGYFGPGKVTRGNKAFDVHANTYRVDADVVATYEHRRYVRLPNGSFSYASGTQFLSDNGSAVINWPEQNYERGVAKNEGTNRRYKRMVRVIKKLKLHMAEKGVTAANPIPSYLIECLLYNIADPKFEAPTYEQTLRAVLLSLWSDTRTSGTCSSWVEVNGVKDLFTATQPWDREQVNQFAAAAWHHIGFK